MAAAAEEIKELLERTTLPAALVAELVEAAPALWLGSNAPSVLAGDLVLCHPELRPGEVRARALPFAGAAAWRLTVLAPDRPGLLADTAAVLAGYGLSIASASAGTWPMLNLALHAMSVPGAMPPKPELQELGRRLQAIRASERPSATFLPAGPVSLDLSSEDGERWLLHVLAPDQVGLLWRICCGLADMGLGIQAAAIGGSDGLADDLFVLDGQPDLEALRRLLTDPAIPAIAASRPTV